MIYKDFIKDFPTRCKETLEFSYDEAEKQGREVTLMLMAATSGFLVSFERGRERKGDEPYVSEEDFVATGELQKRFGAVMKSLKRDKIFWKEDIGIPEKTKYKIIDMKPSSIPVDQWQEIEEDGWESIDNVTFGYFVSCLRNSLAHGVILTKGERTPKDKNEKRIKTIYFISEHRKKSLQLGYNLLKFTPEDFRYFLDCWFSLLVDLKVNPSELAKAMGQSHYDDF